MNKKLQLLGKFSKFFLLLIILGINTPSYATIMAPNPSIVAQLNEDKVTLKLENASIKSILYEIQKQTKINFIYTDSEVSTIAKKSINVKNVTVAEVLNTIFAETGFTYKINGNSIAIVKKAPVPQNDSKVIVSGKVIDSSKKPIAGATVIVKGSPVGAITDDKGIFTIVTSRNVIFEVSFMGMKSEEVNVATATLPLVIALKEDALAVDDVVVTGYQTVNRRDMVGSHTTIKADDIRIEGVTNILDMLQGQVAGMIVTNSSSRVGSSPKIKIRGTATFGSTDPIFVVDGIIQPDPIQLNSGIDMAEDLENIIGNQVSWLNPNDIETITVLKDASATAIYGSRASNGVIVITTKKPKNSDRLNINYHGGLTVKPRPRYSNFNYMNSQERIIFSEEVFAEGARYVKDPIPEYNTYEGIYYQYLAGTMSEKAFFKRKVELESMNTDWLDILTRTAVSTNHNISISGASEKATYRVSLGYSNDKSVEKGNSGDRITANAGIGLQLHKKVRFDFSLNASLSNTSGYGPGVNPLQYATTTSRAIPAYDEDGSYSLYKMDNTYQFNNANKYLKYSILNEMEHSESTVSSGNINASLTFSWDVTKWLKYEFTGGASYATSDRSSYASEQTFYIAKGYRGYDYNTVDPTDPWYNAAMLPRGGEKFRSNAINRSYNLQNKLIYQKEFNDNHRLNVMFAMEVRSASSNDAQNTIYGFAHDKGNMLIKPTAPNVFAPIGTSSSGGFGILDGLYSGRVGQKEYENNFMSFFMTAAYSIKNKYVLNANARNDMSNRFGQDANHRLDPTYSFGVAWRVSAEPWMESLNKIFTNVNLKATYGIQGNANLRTSPDLILIQTNILDPFKDFGAQISSIPNPNLSWERTKNWNFGLDLRLFNCVNVMLDYYTKKSNAVIDQNIPLLNGIDQMKINGGILYNSGAEIFVSFNPVVTKNFGINVSLNSSRNWNKGGKTTYDVTPATYLSGLKTSILKEGYPISGFWSYDFAGLNPVDGKPTFKNMDVAESVAKVDPTTVLVYSGQSEPDFTGGLNFSIRYKNLTLASGLSVLLGGKSRLPNPYDGFSNGAYLPDAKKNVSKDLNNRWKKPGDELHTTLPGVINGSAQTSTPFGGSSFYMDLYNYSSERVVSSSFLRCNNLTLSYKINSEKIQKIGFNSLSVGGSVSNLFVIASKRYNGFDPELGNSIKPQGYSLSLSFGF